MSKILTPRNILSALAVAVVGFILLNVTFLVYALFATAFNILLPRDSVMIQPWLPPARNVLFLALIVLISWFVFRTKLSVLAKAIFMTVPLAVVFVTLGILFNRWPVAVYSISLFFSIAVTYYLYRTRQPWLYYYTLALVGVALAVFTLSGGEI